jgi:hypothetical protein
MIRRHPGTSSAILLLGVGIAAGIAVSLAMKGRFSYRRPLNFLSTEALSDCLTNWRR